MIRSMTGFGDAVMEREGVHYAVELRSVNNRYFKTSIRLPDELFALEPQLDAHLRRRFSRGHVTLYLSYKDTSTDAAQHVNVAAIGHYLRQIRLARQAIEADDAGASDAMIDLVGLMSLPGVIQPPTHAETADRVRDVLATLVDQACDRLLAMRHTEGVAIVADIRLQIADIEKSLAAVAERAPRVVEEYHERLRSRVQLLLSRAELKLDAADLAREVALYAERCDISEEIQRLRSHLSQLDALLSDPNGEPVGRTLDFLAQELLREANTIASKSNDAPIARQVVHIKGAIDRIKEQVQNIE